MNALEEYQSWNAAIHARNDASMADKPSALVVAALGINGELGELFDDDANVVEEAGDVYSYAALAASILGLSISDWMPEEVIDSYLVCVKFWHNRRVPMGTLKRACKFSELVKKFFVHGHSVPVTEAAKLLSSIMQDVAIFCAWNRINIRSVLLANVLKLEARYPNSTAEQPSAREAAKG